MSLWRRQVRREGNSRDRRVELMAAKDMRWSDAGWAHGGRLPSRFGLSRDEGWCIIASQQWRRGCRGKRALSVMGVWKGGSSENRIRKLLV